MLDEIICTMYQMRRTKAMSVLSGKHSEQVLLNYIAEKHDIHSATTDANKKFYYFATDNIQHPMLLKAMGYKVWYQERMHRQDYWVRVLNPSYK